MPLISRQIYEHLFVMDIISPESHAKCKKKKKCISCLSHEIQLSTVTHYTFKQNHRNSDKTFSNVSETKL